ncbi:hypothetical protein WJX74_009040 [Apatococcus lobatus]|uniref:BI1-like protein n=1 Tax=Apatococcus lobatus TaxID=904363 RepID=A0AAW1S7X8_9CHLO
MASFETAGEREPFKRSYNTDDVHIDIESQEEVPLHPAMSPTENMLRWGFVRKVYGIIAAQLVLTCCTASLFIFSKPVNDFATQSAAFQVAMFILPLIGLIPLYIYQKRHPTNLIILALWTMSISTSVGMACSFYQPLILLEAVGLTASIVAGLTAYTFYASRKGHEFGFMGPTLFLGLWSIVAWSFLQFFFPPGPIQSTIFALLGTLLFSGYIIFDTWMLIQKYDLDEYIWASVNLYLDIINLFLKILQLLSRRD